MVNSTSSELVIQSCSVKRCPQKSCKIHKKIPVPQACNFTKKETLAQAFFCEFCEIFKSTFIAERLG